MESVLDFNVGMGLITNTRGGYSNISLDAFDDFFFLAFLEGTASSSSRCGWLTKPRKGTSGKDLLDNGTNINHSYHSRPYRIT
jgi:hypothetical protein